jgi:hypothetical protein
LLSSSLPYLTTNLASFAILLNLSEYFHHDNTHSIWHFASLI